jgi:hypothetical protein
MTTPHENAMILWENYEPIIDTDGNELEGSEMTALFAFSVVEDKGADAIAQIRNNGWIYLYDAVSDDFMSFSPDDFEKICKWYLGIE